MTKKKTIRQLVLDFAEGNENLGNLDDRAAQVMGFDEKDEKFLYRYRGRLEAHNYLGREEIDLHELSHVFSNILGRRKLKTPSLEEELGASIINLVLKIKLPDEYEKLFNIVREYTSGQKNALINKFFTSKKADSMLKKPLEDLISDEEINERIKLALIIGARIANSNMSLVERPRGKAQRIWPYMHYLKEQSHLTISGILPQLTVPELKKIDLQHLLNYAKHGIIYAIDNGLPTDIAEKIDEIAMGVAVTVLNVKVKTKTKIKTT